MNRITRLFGSMFFRNLRCLNQVVYFRTILLKSRHICTTTNNFASFSGRVITSPSRTRKLCDVPTATCWKCSYSYSASVNGDAVFFCPSCGVIQELISDRTYFDIMNCKQTFDLDTKLLTQQFRSLQSKLHPDKFSLKSEMEQNLSSLQSSLVNEAYQMLLKPLARGLYLGRAIWEVMEQSSINKLELQGLSIQEGNVGSDIEFLSEIMEMNETLENGSEDTLRKLRSQIEDNLELCTKKASEAFNKQDFVAAKEILSQMKYYNNISEQIREKIMA